MESAGNSIIDFGRFLTGFLVLTGIGESSLLSILEQLRTNNVFFNSTSGRACA